MTQPILLITVTAAYICTALSGGLAAYFWFHRNKPLGLALSIMLACESVAMAVVAAFATLEYAGALLSLDPLSASAIRWVAICATGISSIHLAIQVRRVLHTKGS